MPEIKTDIIDPRPVIEMLFGAVPDFVTYDPEFSSGDPIYCQNRHDGTLLHSSGMKEKIYVSIADLIVLAKLRGWRKLTLSAITRTTEFKGLYFSQENENSGMVERWPFHMDAKQPAPDYSDLLDLPEGHMIVTAEDLPG